MNNYIFTFFQDPNVFLLSGANIEANSLKEAVEIFDKLHPNVEILYIHNKKFEIWKKN